MNNSKFPIDSAKVEDTGEAVASIKRIQALMLTWLNAQAGNPAKAIWDEIESELDSLAAPRLPNTTPSTQAVEDTGEPWQVGDDTSSVQISRDGSTHKWGCKCEGCAPTTQGADGESLRPVAQAVVDHCWTMYQQGRISADHTAKEVFAEVLQSFAKWLATRDAAPK